MCIFAPHSFLHYTINTRYDRRQLSYQQRTCVHNAFDDIMEHTIECDDPLETKGNRSRYKKEVEQTFGTPVSTGSMYQEIEMYLSLR